MLLHGHTHPGPDQDGGESPHWTPGPLHGPSSPPPALRPPLPTSAFSAQWDQLAPLDSSIRCQMGSFNQAKNQGSRGAPAWGSQSPTALRPRLSSASINAARSPAASCWGEWRFLAVSCWGEWRFLFLVGVCGDSSLFPVGMCGDSWLFLAGVCGDSWLFLVGMGGDSWLFLVGMRGVGPGPISLPRPEAEVLPVSLISTFLWAQLGSLVQEPCLSRVTTSDTFSLQTRSAAPSPWCPQANSITTECSSAEGHLWRERRADKTAHRRASLVRLRLRGGIQSA